MSSSDKGKLLSKHIFSPDRAVDNTLSVVDDRVATAGTGIKVMIPGTEDVVTPWRSGELIGMLGYTSNGKSSVMSYIVNQYANVLKAQKEKNPNFNHIIAFFTWEQSVEEQTIIDLARVTYINPGKIFKGEIDKTEIEKIKGEGATLRRKLPIWLIGHSVKDDRRRPRLSMADVLEIVIWLEEEAKVKLDLIVLDYLQRIRRMKTDMRESYMDNVDSAKDLTLRCPVLLASQAGRQVLNRPDNMPDLDDSQETSNFEQSCDGMMAVMMPKQKHKIGKNFTYYGTKYIVTDKLIFIKWLKQKMGPAPIIRAYHMEYGGTDLAPAEGTKVVSLVDDVEGKKKKI